MGTGGNASNIFPRLCMGHGRAPPSQEPGVSKSVYKVTEGHVLQATLSTLLVRVKTVTETHAAACVAAARSAGDGLGRSALRSADASYGEKTTFR